MLNAPALPSSIGHGHLVPCHTTDHSTPIGCSTGAGKPVVFVSQVLTGTGTGSKFSTCGHTFTCTCGVTGLRRFEFYMIAVHLFSLFTKFRLQ
jgi:hypothetical protein